MCASIRLIDGGFCNSYLVSLDSGNVLIDYGRHEKMSAALGGIDIRHVLLTHSHRENCADLRFFDGMVVAYGAEYDLLSDLPGYWNRWGEIYDELGTPYVRPPIRGPLGELFKGEDTDAAPFIPVNTPGHSPSHTVYLLDCGGARHAFSGGLIYSGGKLPNLYDCEWDYGYMLGLMETAKSARLLAKYKPDILHPDRGPSIENATEELVAFADRLDVFAEFLLRDRRHGDTPLDSGFLTKPTRVEGVDEISPHLLRVWRNYSNMYIILCGGGTAFLVDCWDNENMLEKPDFDGLMATLTEDYSIECFACVLLTHYHGDHYLSYEAMHEKWGTELWAYKNMVDVIEHPHRYKYPAMLPWYKNLTEVPAARGADSRVTRVDRVLFEGEEFQIYDIRLCVFRLPGQTNMGCGYSAVIDGIDVVFSGDNLFYTAEPGRSGRDCFVVGNAALPEEEGYLKCSRILAGMAPRRLMCGHSNIIDDPMPQIRALETNSLALIDYLRAFSPEDEYEWYADPYWVTPMGDIVPAGEKSVVVRLRIKNHSRKENRFTGKICLADGFWCENPAFDLILPPRGEITLAFLARIVRGDIAPGKYPVTADIRRGSATSGARRGGGGGGANDCGCSDTNDCGCAADFGELFDHVIVVNGY